MKHVHPDAELADYLITPFPTIDYKTPEKSSRKTVTYTRPKEKMCK